MLGQALLTKRMGKTRVIAETGAGQHGVATATAAALFGLECVVYMGEEDTRRQALNVARMRLLGAEVVPVDDRQPHAQGRHQRGDARLGDQRRDAPTTSSAPSPARTRSRRWSATSSGSSATRRAPQCSSSIGRLPDAVARLRRRRVERDRASSHAFLDDPDVRLVGFEAGGDGVDTGRHAAPITGGAPGVLHGARTYVLQDEDGQTVESALDLRRPRLPRRRARARLAARHRPRDVPAGHRRRGDGGVPAALPHRGHHPGHRERARARRRAPSSAASSARTRVILVNLSGRGDKDVDTAAAGSASSTDERVVESEVDGEHRERVAERPPVADAARADAEGRAALVGYLPAGFPDRRRRRSRPCARWSRPASTSSRSACPTPTR